MKVIFKTLVFDKRDLNKFKNHKYKFKTHEFSEIFEVEDYMPKEAIQFMYENWRKLVKKERYFNDDFS